MTVRVALEEGRRRVFAIAVDWPGWARQARTADAAVAALQRYAARYALVADRAGADFAPSLEVDIVERAEGDSTTDFGAPGVVFEFDGNPVTDRDRALVEASWAAFDAIATDSPPLLRKGPRGGGRDRDRMIAHVDEAERAYARKIGVRHRAFDHTDHRARRRLRRDVLLALTDATVFDLPGTPWPRRYAARRAAWHALDHAWEMEDRRC